MSLVAFDTLKYASRLEKSGFERKQAVELAEAQSEVLSELMQEKLATKEDLRETKTELQEQIHQLALQIKETQNTLLRWLGGLIAGAVGILSSLIATLKLFS